MDLDARNKTRGFSYLRVSYHFGMRRASTPARMRPASLSNRGTEEPNPEANLTSRRRVLAFLSRAILRAEVDASDSLRRVARCDELLGHAPQTGGVFVFVGVSGVKFVRRPGRRRSEQATTYPMISSTSPHAWAVDTSMCSPVSARRAVRWRPMRRGRLTVPPAPGIKPRATSGSANIVSGAATTR